MPFRDLHDILLWRPAPIKMLVSDGLLLEQTKLVLFGQPKTFKSFFAMQLGFCASVGAPWLGFKTTRSVVGMIQAEVPDVPFRERVLSMAKNSTIQRGQLSFSTERKLKLDKASGFQELCNDLDKAKVNILIIDPIYKFLTGSGNDEPALVRFLDYMDTIIDKYHLSLVLVHHSRKPQTTITGQLINMGGADLRGPLIEQWADSIVHIQGDIDTDDRVLDFELRHAVNLVDPIVTRMDRSRTWIDRV